MPYPKWLPRYKTFFERSEAKRLLLRLEPGWFAIAQASKAATDNLGQPVTMSWALAHADENEYLAKKMLNMLDDTCVYVLIRADHRKVVTYKSQPNHLNSLNSFDEFVSDLSGKTGLKMTQFYNAGQGYELADDSDSE